MSTRDRLPDQPHRLPSDDIVATLATDAECGLSPDAAARRLQVDGPNELVEAPRRGLLAMFGAQFSDFMIVVLIAAAVVAGIVGEPADSVAIVVIVVLNAVIGFVQEYRAEAAVAALKKIAAPSAQVVRGGHTRQVAARDLVAGDVVVLEAGNIVPADLRLLSVSQLRIDESALTGESQPVEKISEAIEEPDLPIGDRHNLAFKGTVATFGRARGVVVATGMATELGRIAALLESAEDSRTPLQRRLAGFGRRLAVGVLAICGVIFVAGLLRGEPLALMFLTAVSLAVAAIPEALPAVVTVSLALGARRMVSEQALIRRLPAVETLGSVTVICSDKTGTLTANRMHVASLHADGRTIALPAEGEAAAAVPAGGTGPWAMLFRAMALNNDTAFGPHDAPVGDPTEVALYAAARDAGVDRRALESTLPRLGELPFDSTRKRMTTLHRDADGLFALVKGAPESVLPCCVERQAAGGVELLDRAQALAEAQRLAGEGERVLAFAFRRLAQEAQACVDAGVDAVECELVFIGLAGLIDPPRPEAAQAVAQCRTAGIVPVMITGDHPATALAIARRIGLIDRDDAVLAGEDLARMNASELARRVGEVRVYARVDPAQKIRIVEALQQRGEIVAMTGDGVNDAPALQRADIGVAMGRGGTDVAREAAHMVLLDDNFATIVKAVREGRRIYDNIRKFIRFVMTGNAGEIWTLFLAPFLGLPLPLLPIQILWVNLVTDGLPGLALSLERAEPAVMQRPPRPPAESVFAHGSWQHIVWVGVLIGALSLFVQAWGLANGSPGWQTMVFTVLAFSQLFHVLAIRSETRSLAALGLASNPWLLASVVLSVALHLAIVYVPALQAVFKTQPLAAAEMAFCVALASLVLVAVETEKWLTRRGWLYARDRMRAVRRAADTRKDA